MIKCGDSSTVERPVQPGDGGSIPASSLQIVRATVREVFAKDAMEMVVGRHYLHRKTSISYALGLFVEGEMVGVCTFGCPPSRHLQMGACPTDPSLVIELNRLWVSDDMARNTESWFISKALRFLPPRTGGKTGQHGAS